MYVVMMPTPENMYRGVKTFLNVVCGEKSLYPTVVSVTPLRWYVSSEEIAATRGADSGLTTSAQRVPHTDRDDSDGNRTREICRSHP